MISLLALLALEGNLRFRAIKSFRRERTDRRILRRLRLLQALVVIARVGQPVIVQQKLKVSEGDSDQLSEDDERFDKS